MSSGMSNFNTITLRVLHPINIECLFYEISVSVSVNNLRALCDVATKILLPSKPFLLYMLIIYISPVLYNLSS